MREELLSPEPIEEDAIVEELGSTTVVFPGQRAIVDDFGNLLLERVP